jgi:peptide/nickel transport system permease protein
MTRYVLRRLMQMIPVAFIVSFAVFSMTLLVPGDPTITMLGESSTLEQRAALREQLGLNLPIPVQYVRWLRHVGSGDFGRSLRDQEPVKDMLLQRVPVTVELTLMSLAVALVIGIPCGMVAAVRRNTWIDAVVSVVAMLMMSVPYFLAGILLIVFFSIHLGWLPPSGYVAFTDDPLGSLRLMLLPALAVGGAMAGLVMRQTRTSLIGVLSADYIRTARAKGAVESRVIVHHALRNALIPVITVVGLQIGTLLGGAVITETVFSMPGLGRMIVSGISERNFPVVQGAILIVVISILVLNLLTDLSYRWLDRRVA